MKLSSPDEEKALRTMAGLANATAPTAAPAFSTVRRVNRRAALAVSRAATAFKSIFVILTFLLFHPGLCAHRESCFDDRENHGVSSYQRIMTSSLQSFNGGLSPYPI